jgi:hypothetical protein
MRFLTMFSAPVPIRLQCHWAAVRLLLEVASVEHSDEAGLLEGLALPLATSAADPTTLHATVKPRR